MKKLEAARKLRELRATTEPHILEIGLDYVEVNDEATDEWIEVMADVIEQHTEGKPNSVFAFRLTEAWE